MPTNHTHRRRLAKQNRANTRPCKHCGQTVYFRQNGATWHAINDSDGSVHRCKGEEE